MPGDIKAKLEKMADAVRTGGKGSVRRKHKAQHKVSAQDDKKLQASLKKLGVAPIGDVDEVNLFLTGGQEVIHFTHPRVQASIQSNTYVVNGPNEVKRVEDLPSAWGQIAPSNIEALKKLVSQMAAANQAGAGAEGKDEEELPAAEDFEAEK